MTLKVPGDRRHPPPCRSTGHLLPGFQRQPHTQTMPKVFLIQQPSLSRVRDNRPKNMDPLYDHGEVIVLIPSGEHPGFNPERVMRLIRQRLEGFDPKVDYIAHVGGDALSVLMVGMVLADMSCDENFPFEAIQWLRYDRPEDGRGGRTHEGAKYVPTRVVIAPESEETESATV